MASQTANTGKQALLPLQGVKVVELEGLAPTVFTGLVLADFGADVTIVARRSSGSDAQKDNYARRGKKSIELDLKNGNDMTVLKQMLARADVLIDPFRPGVLESLGLGFSRLQELNARLILVRVSGYGQTGPMRKLAGHDINYLSTSGVLSTFGRAPGLPEFPGNILADFAGGGAFGVIGVLLALLHRDRTGRGQEVDVAMHEAVGYLGTFLHNMQRSGAWNAERGQNLLDGGAPFYRCFECSDGQYMAVGALEPQFFARFVRALVPDAETQQSLIDNQANHDEWPKMHALFEGLFKKKKRDEWAALFEPHDCCVTPVLHTSELAKHPQWTARGTFSHGEYQAHPVFSAFSPISATRKTTPSSNQNEAQVLAEYGIKPKL